MQKYSKKTLADETDQLVREIALGEVGGIIGGFPCQDISVAGLGKGLEGERSGLFFEIMRLAKEIKPTFLFLENVAALRTRGLETILQELTKAGYDCRWTMLRASEVGAIHKRERIFILAHNRSERIQGFGEKEVQRKCGISRYENERRAKVFRERSNLHTPRLCGSGNGIPFRVERTHAIGNSVCPLQTRIAFERLMGIAYKH